MAVIAELMTRVGVDTKGVGKGTSAIETKFEKTWRNVKRGAAIGGAAIGAAMAAGLLKAIEREASSDMLAARINLNPAQQEMAGRIAGDLYANAYGESIDDINNTFAAVFREVGDVGEDELGRITEHAQRFGDVFEADTAAAVKTAGALVKNDVAPDMVSAFDTITAAAQEINIPAEELLDNLNEYAEPLGSLGIDGPKAIGLINNAMDAGVRDTDKALDAMKEFAIRTIDGSEATAEAFDSLGLDAEDMAGKIAEGGPAASNATSEIINSLIAMEDPLEQDAAGVALFGTMWEDLGPKAIAALDPMASSMSDVEGRSEGLDDAFDNNATRIEMWERRINGWLLSLGQAPGALGETGSAITAFGSMAVSSGANLGGMAIAMGGVGKVGKKMRLGEATKKMSGFVKAGGKGATKAVTATAGAMRAASAATTAFGVATAKTTGKVVASTAALVAKKTALAAIKVVMLAVTAAQWAWNVAVSANPIGLIIIAIAALIAIIILLVKNWDTVVKFLKKAWEFIKQTAIKVWEAIRDFFVDIWNSIKNFIADAIGKVKDIFLKFHPLGIIMRNWEPIKDFISKTWNSIISFIGRIPGRIRSKAVGMFDAFKHAFKSAINFIIRGWNNLSFTAPKVDMGPLGSFGGFTIGVPRIPQLARGGDITEGGFATVAERGPETIFLPRGAQVAPLSRRAEQESMTLLIKSGGSEMDDLLVKILRRAIRKKGGDVQVVLGKRGV